MLSNVWKPAHLWLAPCWSGQALTLMNQQHSQQANIKKKKKNYKKINRPPNPHPQTETQIPKKQKIRHQKKSEKSTDPALPRMYIKIIKHKKQDMNLLKQKPKTSKNKTRQQSQKSKIQKCDKIEKSAKKWKIEICKKSKKSPACSSPAISSRPPVPVCRPASASVSLQLAEPLSPSLFGVLVQLPTDRVVPPAI